jgi:hypothetical protein
VDFDDDTAPEESEAMELGERERVFEVEWRRMVDRVDGPIEGEVCGMEVMTAGGCMACIDITTMQRVSQWQE